MKKEGFISNDGLATIFWELATLLKSVTPGKALEIMAEEGDPEHKELLTAVYRRVNDPIDSVPMSEAMRETGRFPSYACGLIQVGEASSKTPDALRALSEFYDSRARLDRRIRSALLYPAVMMLLMLVVIAVLLVRVLPIFDDVYASLGGKLTGVAGGLLALGRGLDKAMPVLLVLLAAVVAFFTAFAVLPSFRGKLTAAWRARQGDKGLARKMNDARVAQAMAMGMASGKELTKAVRDTPALLEDVPQAKARCQACLNLLSGVEQKTLSEAIRESGLLPSRECRLLEIARRGSGKDKGGEAEAMERIARQLQEESEAALEDMVSRVEPALVLVCSLLVGLILLSVMLPLMHIMSAIG